MAFRLLLPLASAAVDMQLSLQDPVFIFFFFWMYKPKSLYIKTGSYADSIFKVLRSFRTVFYSVCTILQSHQLCSTIPVPLHPHQHLFFSIFLVVAILMTMRLYLVVLICTSLTEDAGHLFIFLLAVGIIIFGEMSIQNQIIWIFLLLSCRSSFYILDINPLSDTWYTDILSHSIVCLLTLLISSFAQFFLSLT